ncbi:MAG: hypothetical protein IJK89_02285 [Clostridia bacterium]|nr:hypothetical protein [Clostridia bacterium]
MSCTGYKDKKYHKNLRQQTVDVLTEKQAFGKSRNHLKKMGLAEDKITSVETYRTYKKACFRFTDYVEKNHPECTTLKKARRYITEYLDMRTKQYQDGKISADTVKTEASALHKLYTVKPEDKDFYHAPAMHREDIKRSRNADTDINNPELTEFGKGTGLRTFKELKVLNGGDYTTREKIQILANELKRKKNLTRGDHDQLAACKAALRFTDKTHFIVVKNGKGGKLRYAPIVGPHTDEIVKKVKETPVGQKVWGSASHTTFKYMNEHANRAEYAATIYHEYARPIDEIPKDKINRGSGKAYSSQVYYARKDMKGRCFDKCALGMVAVALGHSYDRVHDVVSHYAYKF